MTYRTIRALVEAHVNQNDFEFKSLVQKIAAKQRDEQKRAALLDPLRKLDDIPSDVATLVREVQPTSINDLVLLPRVQRQLNEIGRELRHREELQKHNLKVQSRLLFYGPPGNGKTSCAAAIAGWLGIRAFSLELSSVINSYLGETGKLLAKALRVLNSGHMLIIDEIDAIATSRTRDDGAVSREYNTIVAAFLAALDKPNGGILIATTNRFDIIDSAIVRRFDATVKFPAPSIELMNRLVEKLCTKFNVPAMEVSIADCKNFDDVEKAVQRIACRRALDKIEKIKLNS